MSQLSLNKYIDQVPLAAAWRMIGVYGVTIFCYIVLRSQFLVNITKRGLLKPQGINTFCPLLLGVIFLVVLIIYRERLKAWNFRLVHSAQFLIALGATIAVCVYSFYYTHPVESVMMQMHHAARASMRGTGAFMVVTSYSVLFLPLIPAFWMFFSWRDFKEFIYPLLFSLLFFIAILYSSAIASYYHGFIGPVIVDACHAVLMLFSDDVTGNAGNLNLRYESFNVVIGPVCTGLTMLFLFLALFGCMWVRQKRRQNISNSRAAIALIVGLLVSFAANIIRIVLIMVVGNISPQLGVDLFHSVAGAILFLALTFVYIKCTMPLLKKPVSS